MDQPQTRSAYTNNTNVVINEKKKEYDDDLICNNCKKAINKHDAKTLHKY